MKNNIQKIAIALLCCCLGFSSQSLLAQEGALDCTTATVLTPTSACTSLTGLVNTTDLGVLEDPCGSGGTAAAIWWQFTPPVSGLMGVSNTNDPLTTDTDFGILTGTCGALTCVAGPNSVPPVFPDDAGSGFTSYADGVPVVGGQTYYIEWNDDWSTALPEWDLYFIGSGDPTIDPVTNEITIAGGCTLESYDVTGDAGNPYDNANPFVGTPGVTHEICVTACDFFGDGDADCGWAIDGIATPGATYPICYDVTIPTSCPSPTAFACAEVGNAGDADLTWTPGDPTQTYVIEWGPAGYAPFTGAQSGSGTALAGATTFSASGLACGSTVDFYIQGDCGGVLSIPTGPCTLTVLCPPDPPTPLACGAGEVGSVIFSEDWEGGAQNGPYSGSIGTGGTAGAWNFPVTGGAGGSVGTGASGAHSGLDYAYMEGSGAPAGVPICLQLPPIDLVCSTTDAELSFWLHQFGGNMDSFVQVSDDGGATFTQVVTVVGTLQTAETDPWANIGADLTPFIGSNILIEFCVVASGFESDMSIDLIEISSCSDPAVSCCTVQSTGLVVSACDDGGTPSDSSDDTFSFDLDPAGLGIGTTYTVTDAAGTVLGNGTYGTPLTVPGNIAGGGDLNLTITDDNDMMCTLAVVVVDPGSCSPLPPAPLGVSCVGAEVPQDVFCETFDTPAAWAGSINNGNQSWLFPFVGGTVSGGTGPDGGVDPATGAVDAAAPYAVFESSVGTPLASPACMESPAIDLTCASGDIELSFWLHAFGPDITGLDVEVSTDGGTTWANALTTLGPGGLQTANADPWVPVGVNLASFAGQTINIRFCVQAPSVGFTADMGIDDILIQACTTTSACANATCVPFVCSSTAGSTVSETSVCSGDTFDVLFDPAGCLEEGQPDFLLAYDTDPLTVPTQQDVYDALITGFPIDILWFGATATCADGGFIGENLANGACTAFTITPIIVPWNATTGLLDETCPVEILPNIDIQPLPETPTIVSNGDCSYTISITGVCPNDILTVTAGDLTGGAGIVGDGTATILYTPTDGDAATTLTVTGSNGTSNSAGTACGADSNFAIAATPMPTIACPAGPLCVDDPAEAISGTPIEEFGVLELVILWDGFPTEGGFNILDAAGNIIGGQPTGFSAAAANTTETLLINVPLAACPVSIDWIDTFGDGLAGFSCGFGVADGSITINDATSAANLLPASVPGDPLTGGLCGGGITNYNFAIGCPVVDPTLTVAGTLTGPGVTDNADGTGTFDPATAGVGVHTLSYTVTDNNGCTASATCDVEVIVCTGPACPTVTPVDGTADVCADQYAGEVATWQASLGADFADPDGTNGPAAGLLYSDVPMTDPTFPVASTGNAAYDGDGCAVEIEEYYAYYECDADGDGTAEMFINAGSYTLTLFAPAQAPTIADDAAGCIITITPACAGDVLSAPGPIDYNGQAAGALDVLGATVTTADGCMTTYDVTHGACITATCPTAIVNEVHYDNCGGDLNEFIEVALPAGSDPTLVFYELYNGNNGASYNGPTPLAGPADGTDGTLDYYCILISGIQNGAPDGIALGCNVDNSLLDFISYEGAMTGVGGVADAAMSTDIGAAENGGTLPSASLMLIGGVWEAGCATCGAPNVSDASCVASCAFDVLAATNIVCDDAGTPGDPSDDTFTFDVTVTGTSVSCTTPPTFSDDAGNAAQAYGSVITYGPYPADGNAVTINFTDDDDFACTTAVMAMSAACSNAMATIGNDADPADPCACNNDQTDNLSGDGDGTFSETVTITSGVAGEIWTVTVITSNAATTNTTGVVPAGIAVGDLLTDNGDGTYEISFSHWDGDGFFIEVTGPAGALTLGNRCIYPQIDVNPFGPLCSNAAAVAITSTETYGNGGVSNYSGPGVTGMMFDPAVAGMGTHTITDMFAGNSGTGVSPDGGVTAAFPTNVCSTTGTFDVTVIDCSGGACATALSADCPEEICSGESATMFSVVLDDPSGNTIGQGWYEDAAGVTAYTGAAFVNEGCMFTPAEIYYVIFCDSDGDLATGTAGGFAGADVASNVLTHAITVYPAPMTLDLTNETSADCAVAPMVAVAAADGTVCGTATGTLAAAPVCPATTASEVTPYSFTFDDGTPCEQNFSGVMTSTCDVVCPCPTAAAAAPTVEDVCGDASPTLPADAALMIDDPNFTVTWSPDPATIVNAGCALNSVVFTPMITCTNDCAVSFAGPTHTLNVYPDPASFAGAVGVDGTCGTSPSLDLSGVTCLPTIVGPTTVTATIDGCAADMMPAPVDGAFTYQLDIPAIPGAPACYAYSELIAVGDVACTTNCTVMTTPCELAIACVEVSDCDGTAGGQGTYDVTVTVVYISPDGTGVDVSLDGAVAGTITPVTAGTMTTGSITLTMPADGAAHTVDAAIVGGTCAATAAQTNYTAPIDCNDCAVPNPGTVTGP